MNNTVFLTEIFFFTPKPELELTKEDIDVMIKYGGKDLNQNGVSLKDLKNLLRGNLNWYYLEIYISLRNKQLILIWTSLVFAFIKRRAYFEAFELILRDQICWISRLIGWLVFDLVGFGFFHSTKY